MDRRSRSAIRIRCPSRFDTSGVKMPCAHGSPHSGQRAQKRPGESVGTPAFGALAQVKPARSSAETNSSYGGQVGAGWRERDSRATPRLDLPIAGPGPPCFGFRSSRSLTSCRVPRPRPETPNLSAGYQPCDSGSSPRSPTPTQSTGCVDSSASTNIGQTTHWRLRRLRSGHSTAGHDPRTSSSAEIRAPIRP